MRDRLMAALAGAFGLLAGSLAVLGLYGVIAYMVARRRNEIGVRIALGASRGRVIGLVLREAVLLLAIGLILGTALAAGPGQAAASLVYGLTPRDPATLGGAVAAVGDGGAVCQLWTGVESVAAAADGRIARRIGTGSVPAYSRGRADDRRGTRRGRHRRSGGTARRRRGAAGYASCGNGLTWRSSTAGSDR
jgi:hypothetical protein